MQKYRTLVDRWISHECRMVRAGEEFTTEFPLGPEGKPMTLGDTLEVIEDDEDGKPAKADKKGKPGKGSEGGKGNDDLA